MRRATSHLVMLRLVTSAGVGLEVCTRTLSVRCTRAAVRKKGHKHLKYRTFIPVIDVIRLTTALRPVAARFGNDIGTFVFESE
jgi:hypothetical protein